MIEVVESDGVVILTYSDSDGNTSKCEVLGLSKEEVENRSEEFVKTHNLKDSAQS